MQWIFVKDNLHEFGKNYLFFSGKKEVTLGSSFSIEDDERIWIVDIDRGSNEIATHWMPLPDPPMD